MKIKTPFSKTNILIMAPLMLVMALDLIFTIVGQSEAYWQDYSLFNEASPLGFVLFSFHPAYFILFLILYLLFVPFLVINLRRPLNMMVAIGFFLGHSWGGATWISTLFCKLTGIYTVNNWYIIIGYFIIIAIISGFCINQWFKKYTHV